MDRRIETSLTLIFPTSTERGKKGSVEGADNYVQDLFHSTGSTTCNTYEQQTEYEPEPNILKSEVDAAINVTNKGESSEVDDLTIDSLRKADEVEIHLV